MGCSNNGLYVVFVYIEWFIYEVVECGFEISRIVTDFVQVTEILWSVGFPNSMGI